MLVCTVVSLFCGKINKCRLSLIKQATQLCMDCLCDNLIYRVDTTLIGQESMHPQMARIQYSSSSNTHTTIKLSYILCLARLQVNEKDREVNSLTNFRTADLN